MPVGNGNKFKGNKVKKSARGRKSGQANFDAATDQYACVVNIEGGKHVNVLLLDSVDKKSTPALIPGKFHRKVWFKKDDLVVVMGNGNLMEIKGMVSDSEIPRIRSKFDKLHGNNDRSLIFGNDDDNDDGSDEEETGHKVNTVKESGDNDDFDISTI
jgi:translation initiation factor IF-1